MGIGDDDRVYGTGGQHSESGGSGRSGYAEMRGTG
jgi:hypothetical protein